jgi:hypothetical protein
MFQRFGLGIDLAPVETENARQEEFHKPMPPDDAPRFGDALGRELGAATGFIADPARFSQAFEHTGDGGGADLQAFGNIQGGNHRRVAAEAVDGFQVILDCVAWLIWHE